MSVTEPTPGPVEPTPAPTEEPIVNQRGPSPSDYPAPPDQGPRIDVVPTHNGVEVRVDGAGTQPSLYTNPLQMHQLLSGLQHAWEQFTLGQV